MRSNYKKIGPYIREVAEKNSDLAVELLLGVSVAKEFIPSIANIIGTDMSTYKIVRKDQFAYGPVTSRNSDKVSIALLNVEECIVSTSYTVFEIIDHDVLLPEYLMMWFRRPEFDRYARFKSHGSVRELFDWDEMCDVELPMPSIEKQREIVKEYHTIVDRIKLNERLNQKLEETAQAIYKQWFVDFEFPISAEYAAAIGKPELEGRPYKSNSGEMVFNEVLKQEIPKGWEDCLLEDVCIIHDSIRKPLSGDERSTRKGPYPYYGAVSIVDYIDNFLFDGIYLLFSEDGIYVVDEFGHPTIQYVWGKFWVNNHAHILQGDGDVTTEFILLALSNTNVSHLVTGAAQPKINQKNMASIPLLKPVDEALKQFTKLINPFFRHVRVTTDILRQLSTLRDMLLLRVVAHESNL